MNFLVLFLFPRVNSSVSTSVRLVNWPALILKHVSFVQNFTTKPLSSYLFSRSFDDDVLHYEYTTAEHDQFPDFFLYLANDSFFQSVSMDVLIKALQ